MDTGVQNQPSPQQQGCSLFTLIAYGIAFVVMVWLIRWSWVRRDWVGLVVAIASPWIGLFVGAVSNIVFAWLFFAFAWAVSAEFRNEFREARFAATEEATESASFPDQTDLPS